MAIRMELIPDHVYVELLIHGLRDGSRMLGKFHHVMVLHVEPPKSATVTEICYHRGAEQDDGSPEVRQSSYIFIGGTYRERTYPVVAGSMRDHLGRTRTLREEQHGLHPQQSTTDIVYVMMRLTQFSRTAGHSLYMHFVDQHTTHTSADRRPL